MEIYQRAGGTSYFFALPAPSIHSDSLVLTSVPPDWGRGGKRPKAQKRLTGRAFICIWFPLAKPLFEINSVEVCFVGFSSCYRWYIPPLPGWSCKGAFKPRVTYPEVPQLKWNKKYLFFCGWLILFNVVSCFIHAAVCVRISFLFKGQLVFHCICIPCSLYPLAPPWTVGLFSPFGYCESCCYELEYTHTCLRASFQLLGVYIHKWTCWVQVLIF